MTEQNSTTTKRCEACKEDVPLLMFSKNRSTKDGFAKACKPCRKTYDQAYYEKNKERRREKNKQNYLANPAIFKARARKWEKENIERKRELRAIYRLLDGEKIKEFSKRDWIRHREKRLAKSREYRLANPERGAEHVRARQTRKQQAMPAWADRDAIRAIYAKCRRISQETGIKHHVDHYYPLKNSLVCGLHCEYNLQVLPAVDNQSKSNRIPE